MPKIVDCSERRRRIAASAVSVFVRQGYHEANLSEIAQGCELGRTTIYKYFKNKEEVLFFALDEIFGRIEGDIAALAADSGLAAFERLSRLFELLLQDSVEDKERMLLLLDLALHLGRAEPRFETEVRKRVSRLATAFESLLAEGLAGGAFRPHDPKIMAHALISLIEAYVLQYSFSEAFSFSEAMTASGILLEGLRREPIPRPALAEL